LKPRFNEPSPRVKEHPGEPLRDQNWGGELVSSQGEKRKKKNKGGGFPGLGPSFIWERALDTATIRMGVR